MHPDKEGYYTAGDPKIEDISGPEGFPDGIINEFDKTFLGSFSTPDWYGGITNTFSYKGFELSVLIESVQGISRINEFISSMNGRDNSVKVNYWTPDNPSNDFPQPNSFGRYDFPDAVRIQDASFISIRNLSFSYHLPRSLTKRLQISDLVVFVRGNNLKYYTDYKLAYSPELEHGNFPVTRSWHTGINITFN